MRTTTKMRSKLALLFIALAALIAIPALTVLADELKTTNGVDTATDSVSLTAGSSANVEYLLSQQNLIQEGAGGLKDCNATTASPTNVTFTVTPPAGGAASDVTIDYAPNTPGTQSGPLQFMDCGGDAKKSVTFTGTKAGNYTISASATGAGNYTTTDATFTLKVAAADPAPDTTAPVITPNITGTLGSNGWYTSDVNLTWSVTDPDSSISSQSGCDAVSITSDQDATSYTCTATSGGGTASHTLSIKRDATAPTNVAGTANPAANAAGWHKSPLTVNFSGQDALSGIDSCDQNVAYSGPDSATASVNGTCTDNAGNSTQGAFNLKYDATAPTNVAFSSGGPSGSYDFGSNIPAAPTCSADDATSGLASCLVTDSNAGGPNAVGSHTLTATATDNADNIATAERSYTVVPATAKGFYQPIDMNNVVNTVKGGSTVPAKFELFGGASGTEQKNLSAVSSVSAKQINCTTLTSASDAIEEIVSTNATGLRFDTTGDQFIYNWKTPKSPGACYSLTMTAADGQTKLVAYFKLT